jgi:hypothetical protein
MNAIWNSGEGVSAVGSERNVATLFGSLARRYDSNQALAEEAARRNVRIMTAGNRHDCLYDPAVSGLPSYVSTQWLRGTDDGSIRVHEVDGATCATLPWSDLIGLIDGRASYRDLVTLSELKRVADGIGESHGRVLTDDGAKAAILSLFNERAAAR